MKKTLGFTLIELMIVVAIIGILAAIALPAHKNYIAMEKCVNEFGAEIEPCRAALDEWRSMNPKRSVKTSDFPMLFERLRQKLPKVEEVVDTPAPAPETTNQTPSPAPTTSNIDLAQSERVYVDNRVEGGSASLKRHYDGKLYACTSNNMCYELRE